MITDFINPHSAYYAKPSVRVGSVCDLDCSEKYLPKRFQGKKTPGTGEIKYKYPLFKKVGQLLCHYENSFTDQEILEYFRTAEEFFRTSTGFMRILNWYSLVSWLETTNYNWYDDTVGEALDQGEEDFYQRYGELTTEDLWLSFAGPNNEETNPDGIKYWRYFLEPYVGTNLIQRKLIEKVQGLNGKIVDWYEDDNIINAYSFQFDEFPGWEKTRLLIIASKLLKNAESILTTIRDENCPHRFILSLSHLDTDYLSGITALRFEGVNICFQRFENELIGDPDDSIFPFRLWKFYTKAHEQLIYYYNIRKLSDDLILDELLENKIYETHTPIRPIIFAIMPPPLPDHGHKKWDRGQTWEKYYTWIGQDLDDWIREFLPFDRTPIFWDTSETWDSEMYWVGDPEDWTYKKPPASRSEYYTDRNEIPGYESWSGVSLYRTMVYSEVNRVYDPLPNNTNNRSQVVYYWDRDAQLTKTLHFDGNMMRMVFRKATREDTSGRYGGQVVLYSGDNYDGTANPYLLTVFEENIHEDISSEIVRYWDSRLYSENLELDGYPFRTVFKELGTNVGGLTTEFVRYWDVNAYSGTLRLEGAKTKFVMGKVTREDTSGRYGGQVVLYSGDNYDGTANPYLFTIFKENLIENTNASINKYWNGVDYSETLELDGDETKVVFEKATREDMSGRYGGQAILYSGNGYDGTTDPYLLTAFEEKSFENISDNQVMYWDEKRYSDNLELDGYPSKIIFKELGSNVSDLRSSYVKYWEQNLPKLDGRRSKVVMGKATREDTSLYQSEIIPIGIQVQEDKERVIYNSKLLSYWDEDDFSQTLELDELTNKVVYIEKTRES